MRSCKSTTWLVVAAVMLAACTSQTGQNADPTGESTPTSTPVTTPPGTVAEARSDFPANGPVEAGTYHIPSSAWNIAGLTLTMPEGWETQYGSPGALKHSDQDGELGFYFVIVDSIYADPCIGSEGEGASNVMDVGPDVDDLANALLDQPRTVTSGPVDTSLGDLPAKRIDLTMAEDPETATMGQPPTMSPRCRPSSTPSRSTLEAPSNPGTLRPARLSASPHPERPLVAAGVGQPGVSVVDDGHGVLTRGPLGDGGVVR